MGKFHQKRFPGESEAYRQARDELLSAEIALRKHVEEVAALRRKLPLGGELKEDYVFDEGAADLSDQKSVKQTRFSELFEKWNLFDLTPEGRGTSWFPKFAYD